MKLRPPEKPAAVIASAKRAFKRRAMWDATLDDVYDLILPFRKPSDEGTEGAPAMDRAFDSTAPQSALRFAGRLQNDIVPPFQEIAKLELGPAGKRYFSDKAKREEAEKGLQTISEAVRATIESGTFSTASHEMFIDLVAGQGALLMSEGDDDEPVIYESVPAKHIAIVDGRGGKVVEIHYRRKWTAREIDSKWPDREAEPVALKEAIKTGGEAAEREFEVFQSTVWDGHKRRWVLHVCMEGGEGKENGVELFSQESRACPWLTPRFFKVPGEPWGRGPAMMALPDVRVANKTVELTLRAAALAILGLWTRTPDVNGSSGMNISKFRPGSIIPVASNGGSRGRSIEPLDVPRNFNVSNILLSDYRERIRDVLFDRAIPRSDGTPRSASEVIETLRLYAEDLAAVYGRLVKEIVIPLFNRTIEILHKRGLIPNLIEADQLFTAIKVVSPLADAQNVNDLQRIVRWLELMATMLGEEMLMLTAKVEDIGPHLARLLGVDPGLIRSETDRKKMQEQIADLLARAKATTTVDSASAAGAAGAG